MKKLIYIAKTGKFAGKEYYPHLHQDGYYVVSPTRFENDYIRVKTLDEVYENFKEGLKVRMSHNRISPSLISPKSIKEY